MPEDSLKIVGQDIQPDTNLQKSQELYPNIYDVYSLTVDNSLPLVIFKNFTDTLKTKNEKINLSVQIPGKIKKADLFLLVNKIKRDMYYRVGGPGIYDFNDILLEPGENIIEIFYRINNRKSASSYLIVIKIAKY